MILFVFTIYSLNESQKIALSMPRSRLTFLSVVKSSVNFEKSLNRIKYIKYKTLLKRNYI